MTPGRTGDSRFGVPGSPGSEQPLTVLPTQPPAEDKINGILLGFRLRYRELVYDSLRGFTLRGIGNPGATWAELTRECPRTLGGCVAGGGGGGVTQQWQMEDGAGQHPALHGLSWVPTWSCQGSAVPHGAVTGSLVPPGPWSLTRLSVMSLAQSRCAQHPCPCSVGVRVSAPNVGCLCDVPLCVSGSAAVLRPQREQGRIHSGDSRDTSDKGRAQDRTLPHPPLLAVVGPPCGDPDAQLVPLGGWG